MRLRNLDLNLLLVFDAVLRERSVVRAADSLAISQPAVSHALNRLRHALKDQLFVRTPAGMSPTPRAEQLALPVRKALNDLQLAVEGDTSIPHRRPAVHDCGEQLCSRGCRGSHRGRGARA